jgi:hypothetical protein
MANITVPSNKKEKEGKDIIENICQTTFKSKDYHGIILTFLILYKLIFSIFSRIRRYCRIYLGLDKRLENGQNLILLILNSIISQKYIDIYNDNHDKLERFLQELEPIQEKILVIVLKVPSTFTLAKDREWLNTLLKFLNSLNIQLQ